MSNTETTGQNSRTPRKTPGEFSAGSGLSEIQSARAGIPWGSVDRSFSTDELLHLGQELSLQERTVIWAHAILGDYNGMINQGDAQKKGVKKLVNDISRDLLAHPRQLTISMSVWKSSQEEQDVSSDHQTLYVAVREQMKRKVRKNWHTIKPEQLAAFVRTLAHAPLIEDVPHTLLDAFFKGPSNQDGRAESMYRFLYGVLDLVEDTPALERGVEIALFKTDIVSVDSGTYADYLYSLHDVFHDQTLQKALITDAVLFSLINITTLDEKAIRQEAAQRNRNKENWPDKVRTRMQELESKLSDKVAKEIPKGNTKTRDRFHALWEFHQQSYVTADRVSEWPYSLVIDSSDPLRRKFDRVIGPKASAIRQEREVLKRIDPHGKITSIEITVPDSSMVLTILVPEDTRSSLRGRELIKRILHDESLKPVMKELEDEPVIISGIAGVDMNIADIPISVIFRKKVAPEERIHRLQELQNIGFPILRESLDLEQDMPNMVRQIQQDQIRFFNRRGVRVELSAPEFTELGYTHIDFHRGSNPDETIVKIGVLGLVYEVMLDPNYNFDFQGLSFNAPGLAGSLKYTLLSLLKPILCDEILQQETGEDLDINRQFYSRMGHLRRLPEGQRYSQTQVGVCFEIEGRDLDVINAEKRTRDELEEGRYVTYVSPVILDDDISLSPVVYRSPSQTTGLFS